MNFHCPEALLWRHELQTILNEMGQDYSKRKKQA